jgi:hypothetical protein
MFRPRVVCRRVARCCSSYLVVKPDPEKAALFLRRTIEEKCRALGLGARSVA